MLPILLSDRTVWISCQRGIEIRTTTQSDSKLLSASRRATFPKKLLLLSQSKSAKIGSHFGGKEDFLIWLKNSLLTGKNHPKEVVFCSQTPAPELFSNRAVACLDNFRTLPSGVHCTWNTRSISDRMRRPSAESSSSYGSVDSHGRSCSLDE